MKKFFWLSALFLVLFTGCKSLYTSDLQPKKRITKQLPPLTPVMDIASLENAFGISSTTSNSFATGGMFFNTPYVSGTTNSTTYRDKSINDLQVLFNRDVEGAICEANGERKGFITCRVIDGGKKVGGGGYTVASWIGAYCFINLLGFPHGRYKAAFQLEVSIYDAQQNKIATYTSPYIMKKAWRAIYYGYCKEPGLRKVAILAYNDCMDNIKLQINKDADKIKQALNK